MKLNDTIVAQSTPQGIGAIGIIRLSGKNSIKIVNTLFPSKDLSILKIRMDEIPVSLAIAQAVSYTHLTLPTILLV